MGTRAGALALVLALLLPAAACVGGEDPGLMPETDATTDADCAVRIPDQVFTTLGWTPTAKGATETVRGCHREAEQGYVEVRDRTASYDKLCATLDRTGTVGPGEPVDWLGEGVTACAVEPTTDVGQTKVVVQRSGGEVTQVTIAVLTSTPRALVRAAAGELVG